ncbi:efflux RND transporter permease subunit [Algiphilus sp. W345]|uniref:Efflux RND transporter permease subunit n=1 Tax=Banduia mediterranea TaxID=3075609 RepID=A0ABU2WEV5_9GAMM|nr:efflux RND transporter permease subunit [Algiphilus sp. W345]MDT0496403.1 efflux RND transporter permease subunit [Algiphilus sp. W345]
MSEQRMNIAGWLAGAFVQSKLTPVLVLAVLLLGVYAALTTPREENPQIVVPGAVVRFVLPGSTPLEMERLIVAPMEGHLREIDGVEHSYAMAGEGVGFVQLQFYVGEDEDVAIQRVLERVAAYRDTLPAGTLEPVVQRVDVDDVPIVTITLASAIYDDYALRRVAERMAERLSTLEHVSVTSVHGGREREIRLNLDPARMQAYGLTLGDGIAMVRASNLSARVGESVSGGERQDVYLKGHFTSVEAVRRMPLGEVGGQMIYLEDIGEVVDGPPDDPGFLTRLGFGYADARGAAAATRGELAAVTIAVAKKPNVNSVVVADSVLAMIEQMRARFVPAGVEVVTTRNDGLEADHTVDKLLFDLAVAVSAVMLVLIPFLGLRQALIVCVSVPLVLSLTVAMDGLLGVTINRISLFALILALGMLVDDAIVVIENIHRHYEHGTSDPVRTAVIAANEIGKPTTMATVTIVLVFASLQILTGMNGAFFEDISFNVSVAIACSLVAAYIVVPWACARWLRPHAAAHHEAAEQQSAWLHRNYERLISPLIRDRRRLRVARILVVLAMIGSFSMPVWQFVRPQGPAGPLSWGGVGIAIMPKDDRNTFAITLDLPENVPVETTDRVAREFGRIVARHPQVSHYLSFVGRPGVVDFSSQVSGGSNRFGPNMAEIRVNLVDKSLRGPTSMRVVEELREATAGLRARYPDMDVRFQESPPGPPTRATLMANIHGSDPETLHQLSALVKQRFGQTWGVIDLFDSEPADTQQIDIVVDKDKALLSGVTTADIEQTVRVLMSGMVVSEARLPGELRPVPIRVEVPREARIDPLRLANTFVKNRAGDPVPLSELTRVERRPSHRPIQRKDNERVTYVGGNVSNATAVVNVIMDLHRDLDGQQMAGVTLRTGNMTLNNQTPDTIAGYELLWDGEMRLTLDAAREMGAILGVVLLIIYLLLVANYRSFSLPLMGMTAIPFGLIGIFPGHWLVGLPFSMASMIGVVALAGVVIRNSLLIIDFVNDYQRQGRSLEEAVRMAGAVRLRPIALTALTVILGTLVLYRDPMFSGLATSLIFGTLASTVLTLLLLPPLYYRAALKHPEWAPPAAGQTTE